MKLQLRIEQIVLAMGDLACFVLAVVVVAELRAPLDKSIDLYVLRNLVAFFGLFLVWHATFYALGLYDARRPGQVTFRVWGGTAGSSVNGLDG